MTAERAFELVAEMEGLIELGGRADPPTLDRIEAIIAMLEGTRETTGIVDSDIRQVRSWAQILFTERMRHNARRPADDIKNILRVHCISLRETVQDTIERAKPLPS